MHLSTPPNNDQQVSPRNGNGPREAGPELPVLVACVPLSSKELGVDGSRRLALGSRPALDIRELRLINWIRMAFSIPSGFISLKAKEAN
jgi:hypothetical protein